MFRLFSGVLIFLHLFTGVGAIVGGLACILNPQAPLGAPVEILQGSPFADFLIPGIALFTILGLGNILSALAMIFKSRFWGCLTQIVGWGLVIWIVVQCIIIDTVEGLHIAFFTIGMVQVLLSAVFIFKHRLFPVDLLLDTYKKLTNQTV